MTLTENLVAVFQQLTDAAPGADAYHLRKVDDFVERDLGPEEIDELFAGFERDFGEAVEIVTEAWGPPTYIGSVDNDDFPAWSEALTLACWQRDQVQAFISLRHDDDHEPMFLEIGALTDEEISTLLYTKS
jgi:hypothetical protein